jgi:hypothetical protein
MDKLKEKLGAAWAWLKLNWKWLLFPLGVLLYVVGRVSARSNTTVVSPGLTEHEGVDEKLKAEAAQKKQAADNKAAEQLNGIEADRRAVANAETERQLKAVEAAQGDPDKVNDLLKKVGKDIREGK